MIIILKKLIFFGFSDNNVLAICVFIINSILFGKNPNSTIPISATMFLEARLINPTISAEMLLSPSVR